jgi:hypothetical protein
MAPSVNTKLVGGYTTGKRHNKIEVIPHWELLFHDN